MSILDQLFGTQPQQDTGGLVQSILSQRFQASPDDAANATLQTATTGGRYISPNEAMAQRIAPAMNVAGTLGQLNMSQLALQRLEEEQMRDRMMWGMEMGKLPFGVTPGNQPVGFQQSNQQPQIQQTQPQGASAPLSSMPHGNPANNDAAAFNAVYGDNQPTAQPQQMAQNAPQSDLTPITTGFGTPYTQGLPEGQQWAKDSQGRQVAMQIPGTVMKGANGEILSTNPTTGEVTQTVPKNPQARQQLESNLQEIAQKLNQLDKTGGLVNENSGFLQNKLTQLAASKNPRLPIGEGIEIPISGQEILQGTPETSLRNDIQSLVKQTLPLYMQAMGITPGMERAVGAQQMLAEALGGGVDKSKQHLLYSLSNLSKQAGTGDLYKQLSPDTSQGAGQPGGNEQSQQPSQNIAPEGTIIHNGQQTLVKRNGQWIQQ